MLHDHPYSKLKVLGHDIYMYGLIATKFSTVGSNLTERAGSKYAEACVLPRKNTAYYAIATDSYKTSKQSDNGSRRGFYCSNQAKDLWRRLKSKSNA